MAILDLLQLLVVRTQKTKTCFVPPANTWPTFTAKMDAFDLQRRPVLKSEDSVAVTTQANDISCGRRQTRLTQRRRTVRQREKLQSAASPSSFFSFFPCQTGIASPCKSGLVAAVRVH